MSDNSKQFEAEIAELKTIIAEQQDQLIHGKTENAELESLCSEMAEALKATRQFSHAQNGERCELCEKIDLALQKWAERKGKV